MSWMKRGRVSKKDRASAPVESRRWGRGEKMKRAGREDGRAEKYDCGQRRGRCSTTCHSPGSPWSSKTRAGTGSSGGSCPRPRRSRRTPSNPPPPSYPAHARRGKLGRRPPKLLRSTQAQFGGLQKRRRAPRRNRSPSHPNPCLFVRRRPRRRRENWLEPPPMRGRRIRRAQPPSPPSGRPVTRRGINRARPRPPGPWSCAGRTSRGKK